MYTSEEQEADKNFLMGSRYGKEAERTRILKAIRKYNAETSELAKHVVEEIEEVINAQV